MVISQPQQNGAVSNPELTEDMMEVDLDGPVRDAELTRNLLVGQALRDQSNVFPFPRGQGAFARVCLALQVPS